MAGGMREIMAGMNDPKNMEFSKLIYCPMIDARRMEVYSAFYDDALREVRDTRAEIISDEFISTLDPSWRMVFAGDGADKCRSILEKHPLAIFPEGFYSSAAYMVQISEGRYNKQQFEDPAYFEPFYLKDFIAGKPRVKGLR